MTKIDIISGFLGAGKTTLIKKLLKEGLNKEKVVLIENEYGEVGIDGGFLKDSGIQITEMNSGCICCTLAGDFVVAIKEILEKYSPERIIIEPSGVGKLSDVMAGVMDLEKTEDVKLDALVTVVNVLSFKKQSKAFGEFFKNQIEHATTVIMSRTQTADSGKAEDCMKMIQDLNPDCAIISTPWDNISGEKILSVMEGRDNLEMKTLAMHHHEHDHREHEEHHHHHHEHDHNHHHEHHHEHDHHHEHEDHSHCDHEHGHCCHDHDHHHEHHGHHHADEIFDTWGKETAHKFSRETIDSALKSFANTEDCGNILRAKGMVEGDGEWIYFDFVEGEYELRAGEPDYTGRLVVIGTELKEDKIEKAFGL